jgi:glycosyltransferase involved in cell wall biosynthesis
LELLAAFRALDVEVSVSRFVDEEVTTTSSTPSPVRRALLQAAESAYFARRPARRHASVAHSLYYDQQLRVPGWPLVVTVNDMIHERFGVGSASLRWAKRLSVRRAALVVVPSRATASDLVRIYPDVRTKIATIPWAIAAEFAAALPEPTSEAAAPFLLYVGTRSGYKNAAVLARGLAGAPDLGDLRLVLAGGEPLVAEERRRFGEALGDEDRVVHVDRPDDEALRRLYDGAAALVVTSRCEGFGLPLLEAMARGCPVACADGGSSAEVAAGHAALFAPDSPEQCAEAVRLAVASPRELREAARVHALGFDWPTTAAAYLNAYESVASRSKTA